MDKSEHRKHSLRHWLSLFFGGNTLQYDEEAMTERQTQTAAVKLLKENGYRVFSTSDNRRSHHTKGLPDLIIPIGRGLWVGLEAKSDTGKLSAEQERLMRDGNIHIFKTPWQALGAVKYGERQLKDQIRL
jgi:hypothetical protein